MKTDGEMSLAITGRDGGARGRGDRNSRLEIFHRKTYLSREFSLSLNFLTLFISRRRCEDSFVCYYLLPYCGGGEIRELLQEGGEQ